MDKDATLTSVPLSGTPHDDDNATLFGASDVTNNRVAMDQFDDEFETISNEMTMNRALSDGGIKVHPNPKGIWSMHDHFQGLTLASNITGETMSMMDEGNNADDDDPLAVLEAAIEADKPKLKPSAEWQKMLDAVKKEQEEDEEGQEETTEIIEDDSTHDDVDVKRSESKVECTGDVAEALLNPRNCPSDEDTPVLLHPSRNDGDDHDNDDEQRKDYNTLENEDIAGSFEELRRQSFSELQPICSRLLSYRADSPQLTNLMAALQDVLSRMSPAGVQSCMDYVIFPLQVALEAIAATRNDDLKQQTPALPAVTSDKTAESCLHVLYTLVQKSPCSNGDQLLGLLHRIAAVLSLSRSTVCEEIRLSSLKITSTALQHVLNVHKCDSLRESLTKESSGPLIGHLSSLLLQCAAGEIEAGSLGSRDIRIEALKALRVFIQAVDNAEALRFFLPGLVTGLTRALLASRATSPAASGTATVEAMNALVSLLEITLGNDVVADVVVTDSNDDDVNLRGQANDKAGFNITVESALNDLRALSLTIPSSSTMHKDSTNRDAIEINNTRVVEDKVEGQSSPPLPPQKPATASLRVELTESWIIATSSKIEEMLNKIVSTLLTDRRSAVREALVSGCIRLVGNCSVALHAPTCRSLLIDTILSLAQDEWPSVSDQARQWLANSSPIVTNTVETSLLTWITALPSALRQGHDFGSAHALKITTCLQSCPTKWLASKLFENPADMARIVGALSECLIFDPSATALLFLTSGVDATSFTTDGTVHLPRMPLGLHLITSAKIYKAVSGLIRAIASVASKADELSPHSAYLRATLDCCIQEFRGILEMKKGIFKSHRSSQPGSGVKKSFKRSGSPMQKRLAATPMMAMSSQGGGFNDGTEVTHWQLLAAQMVVLITELLFGAQESNELENLAAEVLPDLVSETVWSLPTTMTTGTMENASILWSEDEKDKSSDLTVLSSFGPGSNAVKERGCNALLQRTALDCIGTIALTLKSRFTRNGKIIRMVLLPTLEKLGDGCFSVSTAAESAVQAMCIGFTPSASSETTTSKTAVLRDLVSQNADYIIDGLCLQLRQPQSYPRAPMLFAAILRQQGVAPGLIALLAEPARQALLGISIISRRQRPEHVLSFVLCLREIAKGARMVGEETHAELERLRFEIEHRHASFSSTSEDDKKDDEAQKTVTGIKEVESFFESYHQSKNDSENNTLKPSEEESTFTNKVCITMDEWNNIQIARRRAAGCSILGQSVADAVGPLLLSSSLPVSVQSLKACASALEALDYAAKGIEICTKQIEPRISPPGGVLSPPEPKSSTLLPSVHLLWSPLMGALGDWRVSVVENSLSMLNTLSRLAGSFLTRRFNQEAWPKIKALLRQGPSRQRLIAPGQDDLTSPAAIQRARIAALRCLYELAISSNNEVIKMVAPLAGQALWEVANLMGDAYTTVVKEEATKTFVALAGVDPDAAWALLDAATKATSLLENPPPGYLPKGLETCGELKLQALYRQVSEELIDVPWHSDVLHTLATLGGK